MADRRDILVNLIGQESVSGASTKAARGLDRLSDQMDETSDEARRLGDEIDQAERHLRDLALQFARTSDAAERVDLTRAMRRQQTELRRLTKARELIGGDKLGADIGAKAAAGFAPAFVARIGPLLARAPMAGSLGPAAAAIGAPLAVGVASLVGAGIAGAVIGGAAGGGVLGGLTLASRDPRVQSAATALGESLTEMLGRSSAPFVPEVLAGIETIRHEALGMEGDLKRLFGASARHVDPLVRGLTRAAREALPGLTRAIESAGPVVDVLADGLVLLSGSVSDLLEGVSEHSDTAARGLRYLFTIADWGTTALGSVIEGLTTLFGLLDKGGAIMSGNPVRILEAFGPAADDTVVRMRRVGDMYAAAAEKADAAAGKTKSLTDALMELNDLQLGLNNAERAFQQAIDDADKVFDKKVSKLDLGTHRGRAYSEALDRIAITAKAAAQATYDQTGSIEAANAKIKEGRAALYEQARQFGLSEEAAWDYVDSVLSIPREWTTEVSVETRQAKRDVAAMRSVINSLKDRNITIGVRWTSSGDLKVPGGTLLKGFSRGGPIEGAGPKGVDSEVIAAAPGEHVWTHEEVQAAGGHARVAALRRAVLSGQSLTLGPAGATAASATAMAAGGRMTAVRWEVRTGGAPMDELLADLIRRYVRVVGGGDVQAAFGG